MTPSSGPMVVSDVVPFSATVADSSGNIVGRNNNASSDSAGPPPSNQSQIVHITCTPPEPRSLGPVVSVSPPASPRRPTDETVGEAITAVVRNAVISKSWTSATSGTGTAKQRLLHTVLSSDALALIPRLDHMSEDSGGCGDDDDNNCEGKRQARNQTLLRRAAVASAATSSVLFALHLRSSPTARRAWRTAAELSASVSLISTALTSLGLGYLGSRTDAMRIVSGGLSSSVLLAPVLSSVVGMECGMRRFWERRREEWRTNKSLHCSLGLVFMYGLGSLRHVEE